MADSVRVVISGRVQGVGYRAWTIFTASRLGLKGWVRNRNDGTVEAVFSGNKDIVARMIQMCHQGPPAARVEGVKQFPCDERLEEGFIPKPTV